jgi:hypothetical protein
LKRVSAIGADLQHCAVEAQAGIYIGRFKVEVVPKC